MKRVRRLYENTALVAVRKTRQLALFWTRRGRKSTTLGNISFDEMSATPGRTVIAASASLVLGKELVGMTLSAAETASIVTREALAINANGQVTGIGHVMGGAPHAFLYSGTPGYGAEWVDAGVRRVAYYNKVYPGRYQFRVLACNNDGVWSEFIGPLGVPFKITPMMYLQECAGAQWLCVYGAQDPAQVWEPVVLDEGRVDAEKRHNARV